MTKEQLRQARKKLGMTQAALAEELGVHSNTIARAEQGILPILRITELAIKCLLLTKSKKSRGNK